jgi:hypothetical protein
VAGCLREDEPERTCNLGETNQPDHDVVHRRYPRHPRSQCPATQQLDASDDEIDERKQSCNDPQRDVHASASWTLTVVGVKRTSCKTPAIDATRRG